MLLAPMDFVVDLHHGTGTTHLHSVRRVLKTEAAAWAAQRIGVAELKAAAELLRHNEAELSLDEPNHETVIENDIAFHRIIAEAAGQPRTDRADRRPGGRTMRDRLRRPITQPGADETAHREHLSILAALTAHDPDRARTPDVRPSVHGRGLPPRTKCRELTTRPSGWLPEVRSWLLNRL